MFKNGNEGRRGEKGGKDGQDERRRIEFLGKEVSVFPYPVFREKGAENQITCQKTNEKDVKSKRSAVKREEADIFSVCGKHDADEGEGEEQNARENIGEQEIFSPNRLFGFFYARRESVVFVFRRDPFDFGISVCFDEQCRGHAERHEHERREFIDEKSQKDFEKQKKSEYGDGDDKEYIVFFKQIFLYHSRSAVVFQPFCLFGQVFRSVRLSFALQDFVHRDPVEGRHARNDIDVGKSRAAFPPRNGFRGEKQLLCDLLLRKSFCFPQSPKKFSRL